MNAERLQQLLQELGRAGVSHAEAMRLIELARSALVWTISVHGPVAIADRASWELITSECWQEHMDGHDWYRTHPDQVPLDLEDGIRVELTRALNYLAACSRVACPGGN